MEPDTQRVHRAPQATGPANAREEWRRPGRGKCGREKGAVATLQVKEKSCERKHVKRGGRRSRRGFSSWNAPELLGRNDSPRGKKEEHKEQWWGKGGRPCELHECSSKERDGKANVTSKLQG